MAGSGVVSLAKFVLVGGDPLPKEILRGGAVARGGSGIAEFAQRISEVVGDGRKVGLQLQCLLIMLYRFAVPPEPGQAKSLPVPRIGELALASDGFVVVAEGVLVVSGDPPDVSQVEVRPVEIRVDAQGPLVTGDRVSGPVPSIQARPSPYQASA